MKVKNNYIIFCLKVKIVTRTILEFSTRFSFESSIKTNLDMTEIVWYKAAIEVSNVALRRSWSRETRSGAAGD